MTQGDVPTGVTEIYPKSGNSPWVQNFYDIGFPTHMTEITFFWAQIIQNNFIKGDVDVWLGIGWLITWFDINLFLFIYFIKSKEKCVGGIKILTRNLKSALNSASNGI